MRRLLIAALLLTPTLLSAQKKKSPLAGYDRSARAVILHLANVYTSPDTSTQPLTT